MLVKLQVRAYLATLAKSNLTKPRLPLDGFRLLVQWDSLADEDAPPSSGKLKRFMGKSKGCVFFC